MVSLLHRVQRVIARVNLHSHIVEIVDRRGQRVNRFHIIPLSNDPSSIVLGVTFVPGVDIGVNWVSDWKINDRNFPFQRLK